MRSAWATSADVAAGSATSDAAACRAMGASGRPVQPDSARARIIARSSRGCDEARATAPTEARAARPSGCRHAEWIGVFQARKRRATPWRRLLELRPELRPTAPKPDVVHDHPAHARRSRRRPPLPDGVASPPRPRGSPGPSRPERQPGGSTRSPNRPGRGPEDRIGVVQRTRRTDRQHPAQERPRGRRRGRASARPRDREDHRQKPARPVESIPEPGRHRDRRYRARSSTSSAHGSGWF